MGLRLVVDSSALVSECIRAAGREIVRHPDLELVIPAPMREEALHEIGKRVKAVAGHWKLTANEQARLGRHAAGLLDTVLAVQERVYQDAEFEARARLADQSDWPVLALSLTLQCGIWTHDRDFCGTGVATWKTAVLRRALPVSKRK
ncbi:MAG: PIN domain-containing protein [Bryobacter sp.]|jgi:predicted nucleic acid-binding protein|nr:PIN domain-containing protein [Bryobacter sp.]